MKFSSPQTNVQIASRFKLEGLPTVPLSAMSKPSKRLSFVLDGCIRRRSCSVVELALAPFLLKREFPSSWTFQVSVPTSRTILLLVSLTNVSRKEVCMNLRMTFVVLRQTEPTTFPIKHLSITTLRSKPGQRSNGRYEKVRGSSFTLRL